MRFFATLAASVLFAASAISAHALPFSNIVVFGDSLSDNGNLYKATFGIAPAAPYVNGRFSNGPVAVEQLAANLGLGLVDYAYGGATSGIGNIADDGTATTLGAFGLPGIGAEFAAATGNGAHLPTGGTTDSLYVVWGGSNDFESLKSPSVAQSQAAAQAAAGNIAGIVAGLTAKGATQILVPNLPNLGSTPEFLNDAAAITYSNTFNATLAAFLPKSATLFDTNALFTQILNNGMAYGFSNTSTPCTVASQNPGCAGFLFFDQIHPTTAADALLAQNFAAAVTPAATPEPSSLALLGTGLTGIMGVMRRRHRAARAQSQPAA